ncbi:ABC transporter ATP-binding protein [Rhizobium leguminosarum bv. trifolii]|uniref:ABC transporter ATP-binding protein n=1 Tax=Rhizobium leguminosarum bv. trifolii TaxID=386 RepID=A0A3E1C076_RHILT|nr:sn-glycerol-3-phosphate ABC transporter ATP-binding protein UgpC [Rhizobium leguminosarum]RFC00707.1 ABC transporter ATP-binding protein [Rhizobium leguminosarum bv. trifolii]RFC01162.1 ABC transporter ATP-binding protein [Rhizobium leguminosarum bv. trifolii]
MADLHLEGVTKSYGAATVIRGIDLQIPFGEFVVFVGPSGCGKSTLLRMIAGLEPISGGEIRIGGTVANLMEPAERGVAMVFQSYALYPHMTAYKNMAFGLKIAGLDKTEIDKRVTGAAKMLQIEELLHRIPKDMSGGQRQRVAIGRSIVREPRLFLFDEPLSNLDAALRVQTRIEIARLHKIVDATMIYVTHDQVEAMTLADRIVVLNQGNIEQVGTPLELYRTPANLFVAGFIGSPKMNFLPVTLAGDGEQSIARGPLGAATSAPAGAVGPATLGVRPEGLVLCSPEQGFLSAQLQFEEHLGEHRLIYARTNDGIDLIAKEPDGPALAEGSTLHFRFAPESAHFFGPDGRRLGHSTKGTH